MQLNRVALWTPCTEVLDGESDESSVTSAATTASSGSVSDEAKALLLPVLSNRAFCHIKLENFGSPRTCRLCVRLSVCSVELVIRADR